MELDLNFTHLSFPVYVSCRLVGNQCNLNCEYCEKSKMSQEAQGEEMSLDTLTTFIKQYVDAQIHTGVKYFWRGGEPTLRGLQFFEDAIKLQKELGGSKTISNVIHTNGTLLDENWCRFLKQNEFFVYITLDGPSHCHDHYRMYHDGRGSYDDVIKAINLLVKYEIRHQIVANVNDYTVKYPLEIYRFFKAKGFKNVRFNPIVYKKNGSIARPSVILQSYGNFLCTIFDEWIRQDIGKINISIFDETLKHFCGKNSSMCQYSSLCGHCASMDPEGNIYSCHRFIAPENVVGNINRQSITSMMYSRKQVRFGQNKRSGLSGQCKKCKYLRLCYGGCIKDRIGSSIAGEKNHNILCKDYYQFFNHVSPAMTFMAEEIAGGGVPARIMSFFEAT